MKRALVCPLNWGLGHATRCVPIIHQLCADGYQVDIAADGYPLAFLKKQFPALHAIELPSYSIRYASGQSQVFALLKQLPTILKAIVDEHRWLDNTLTHTHYDLVISDNRFGLWTTRTECRYITHQMMIKMPPGLRALEPLAWWIHRQFIKRYNTCLIPDFAHGQTLSGDLSHRYPLTRNARFIGPLSRFQNTIETFISRKFDIVCIVSGVEPQRSLFEKQLIDRFLNTEQSVLIVSGQPSGHTNQRKLGNIELFNHLDDSVLCAQLKACNKIISRSGYSTIMDLHYLNCLNKCEWIPTPGQTEQEYLYNYLKKQTTY